MGREDDYLHVLCHYYMSRRLAYMFRVLQMLAHSKLTAITWYGQCVAFQPGQLVQHDVCRRYTCSDFHRWPTVYSVDVRGSVSAWSDPSFSDEARGPSRYSAGGQLKRCGQHTF
ncbi:uncharacterized protein MELLADRAFT_106601 [Melampsora larici-populina 98AG31]|uniref:CxC5 like cysteine cluster associated with KDZ domain-containing protein n=1 Tax=Melampsora larici-populina (strain 98AG31 / pathotype 3-4-7) TaxID=747676 RepID=F4RM15_MELLP|nr:uncharacterized protein MELLADRAFT_106601 [Melampsora larici-populina 98AG31]EGG06667.1 hypothetical protein MELLADRAFT_106601 [Melampsora larici-populina 98AG31]